MNYRHAYHAGGAADLIKHLILAHLLLRLREKDTAFCVIDTHAGAGSYDLHATESRKTSEAREGVYAFAKLPEHPALAPLQDVLKKWNLGIQLGETFNESQLRFYPGSPAIIRHYLRAGDRLIAIEKQPEEFAKLRKNFGYEKNIQLHERDAWEAMGALIPPPEKRLLVFTDPPYERTEEPQEAFKAFSSSYARASHALMAFWYPIKDPIAVSTIHDDFLRSTFHKILRIEVPFYKEIIPGRLNGSGMLLINPPWKIEEVLATAFELMRPLFEKDTLPTTMEWLRE